ncbi:hypothetical protein [Luteimonas sp. A501]
MKRKTIIAAALLVAAGAAFAIINVGTYEGCSSCDFEGSFGGPEELLFIKTVVDPDVGSWVDGQNRPKNVNLCSTGRCSNYRYIPMSGMFQRIGSPWVKPGSSCGTSICLPK